MGAYLGGALDVLGVAGDEGGVLGLVVGGHDCCYCCSCWIGDLRGVMEFVGIY